MAFQPIEPVLAGSSGRTAATNRVTFLRGGNELSISGDLIRGLEEPTHLVPLFDEDSGTIRLTPAIGTELNASKVMSPRGGSAYRLRSRALFTLAGLSPDEAMSFTARVADGGTGIDFILAEGVKLKNRKKENDSIHLDGQEPLINA